ncbi:hypothetical protein VTN49DRAFT_748 [Thermomyces lanuginosus]|uniref:uncharacterized protein n=1 Tax=Thermomyces lanuginosus TaxID=5541 RepID=UPI0037427E87
MLEHIESFLNAQKIESSSGGSSGRSNSALFFTVFQLKGRRAVVLIVRRRKKGDIVGRVSRKVVPAFAAGYHARAERLRESHDLR